MWSKGENKQQPVQKFRGGARGGNMKKTGTIRERCLDRPKSSEKTKATEA